MLIISPIEIERAFGEGNQKGGVMDEARAGVLKLIAEGACPFYICALRLSVVSEYRRGDLQWRALVHD